MRSRSRTVVLAVSMGAATILIRGDRAALSCSPLPLARSVWVGTEQIDCRESCLPSGARLPPMAVDVAHAYEYSKYSGLVKGKQHLMCAFRGEASDCEIVHALCAVDARLVRFSPSLKVGTVFLPRVASFEELETACRELNAQPAVSRCAVDGATQPLHSGP